MKRTHLVAVAALTLTALILASAQSRNPVEVKTKTIEVTTEKIAGQARGKSYVMDLTRKGKTYSVVSDVTSRVRIRTAKGEMAMTDLMSKLGVTSGSFLPGTKFLIGTQRDLTEVNFGRPLATGTSAVAAGNSLTCGPLICKCDPDIEGDCDGRKFFCKGPTMCFPCTGPDCPQSRKERWTCYCFVV